MAIRMLAQSHRLLSFSPPLIEGVLVARPNRFVAEVSIQEKKDKRVVRCHVPVTGRIAMLDFSRASMFPVPVLLQRATPSKKRATEFTIQAVSLGGFHNSTNSEVHGPEWRGINQHLANKLVEEALREEGDLLGLFDGRSEVQVRRERKVGNSRIDFACSANDYVHYIEVKSPVGYMADPVAKAHPLRIPEDSLLSRTSSLTPDDRMVRHFQDLANTLIQTKEPSSIEQRRASVLFVFQYNAPIFSPTLPPPNTPNRRRLHEAVQAMHRAHQSGVDVIQVNMKFSREGVDLIGCSGLDVFQRALGEGEF